MQRNEISKLEELLKYFLNKILIMSSLNIKREKFSINGETKCLYFKYKMPYYAKKNLCMKKNTLDQYTIESIQSQCYWSSFYFRDDLIVVNMYSFNREIGHCVNSQTKSGY